MAGQDMVHYLDQDFDSLRYCPSKISQCDFTVYGLLPPRPGPLLPQANRSASPLLLNCCPYFLLYQPAPLFSLGLVVLGGSEGSQSSSPLHQCSHYCFVVDLRLCLQKSFVGSPLPPTFYFHPCLCLLGVIGVLIYYYVYGSSQVLQGLQGQMEFGVVPVQGDTAKASWQSQPPPEETAVISLNGKY